MLDVAGAKRNRSGLHRLQSDDVARRRRKLRLLPTAIVAKHAAGSSVGRRRGRCRFVVLPHQRLPALEQLYVPFSGDGIEAEQEEADKWRVREAILPSSAQRNRPNVAVAVLPDQNEFLLESG